MRKTTNFILNENELFTNLVFYWMLLTEIRTLCSKHTHKYMCASACACMYVRFSFFFILKEADRHQQTKMADFTLKTIEVLGIKHAVILTTATEGK